MAHFPILGSDICKRVLIFLLNVGMYCTLAHVLLSFDEILDPFNMMLRSWFYFGGTSLPELCVHPYADDGWLS